jgi:hypothetical protein
MRDIEFLDKRVSTILRFAKELRGASQRIKTSTFERNVYGKETEFANAAS